MARGQREHLFHVAWVEGRAEAYSRAQDMRSQAAADPSGTRRSWIMPLDYERSPKRDLSLPFLYLKLEIIGFICIFQSPSSNNEHNKKSQVYNLDLIFSPLRSLQHHTSPIPPNGDLIFKYEDSSDDLTIYSKL